MVQITPEEVMAQRAAKRLVKVSAPPKTAFLYRVWGKDGSLLYVGKAVNPVARPNMHRRTSWGHEIGHHDFQEYPSEQEALAAEREAIIRERPKYNKRMTYATLLSPEQILQMHKALDIAQEALLATDIDPKIAKLVIQEAKNRVLRAFRQ